MKKIKSVKIFAAGHTNPEEIQLISYTEYDIRNNILVQENYLGDNEIESKYIFKYNDAGLKTEEISYITDDEINEHILYFYNEKNEIIKEEKSYLDGSKSFRIYERDEEKKVVTVTLTSDEDELEEKEIRFFNDDYLIKEKHIYTEENKLKEKHIYEYLDKENLSRMTEFDNKNEITIDRKYFYDENKNLIKQLGINRKQELIESYYFAYDDKNRRIESKINSSYIIKFEYDDENHKMTESRYYQNGMLHSQTVYFYNEDGLVAEEHEIEQIKKYIYDFFEEQA